MNEKVPTISKEEFKKLFKSFFGNPKTIRKELTHTFEIKYNDLIRLNNDINKRIKQQNKAELINFKVIIKYDDGSSNSLDKLDSIESSICNKYAIPTQVELVWTYLIKFEDRPLEEIQEIDICISNNNIKYRIDYTASSWKRDIEGLIENFLSSIRKDDSKLKTIISNYKKTIAAGSLVFLILFSFIIAIYSIGKNMEESEIVFQKAVTYNLALEATPLEKIILIIEEIADIKKNQAVKWNLFYFKLFTFLIIMSIISVIIYILLQSISVKQTNFILLTEKSKQNQIAVTKKYKKTVLNIIISFLTSLGANFVYLSIVN
jgi:hypothetical protein